MKAKKSPTAKGVKAGPKDFSGTNRNDDECCLTITVEEAGARLGISRGSAYTYAKDGTLPTIKLGKRLLVPKAALEKLLACG